MYCMRLADDADCKIPGGTKGRTANKTMPPLVWIYRLTFSLLTISLKRHKRFSLKLYYSPETIGAVLSRNGNRQ